MTLTFGVEYLLPCRPSFHCMVFVLLREGEGEGEEEEEQMMMKSDHRRHHLSSVPC